jgi:hypothetical protein
VQLVAARAGEGGVHDRAPSPPSAATDLDVALDIVGQLLAGLGHAAGVAAAPAR